MSVMSVEQVANELPYTALGGEGVLVLESQRVKVYRRVASIKGGGDTIGERVSYDTSVIAGPALHYVRYFGQPGWIESELTPNVKCHDATSVEVVVAMRAIWADLAQWIVKWEETT